MRARRKEDRSWAALARHDRTFGVRQSRADDDEAVLDDDERCLAEDGARTRRTGSDFNGWRVRQKVGKGAASKRRAARAAEDVRCGFAHHVSVSAHELFFTAC